jgi:hypothetical protein
LTEGAVSGAARISRGIAGRFSISPSFNTLVPHRLQNADSVGIRLPHLLQNDPEGRELVSTGTGMAGTASTIFFMGRETSIFFFCGRVLVTSNFRGVVEEGFGGARGSSSNTGISCETGCWIEDFRWGFRVRTHSSHSLLLSPPEVFEKVRII